VAQALNTGARAETKRLLNGFLRAVPLKSAPQLRDPTYITQHEQDRNLKYRRGQRPGDAPGLR